MLANQLNYLFALLKATVEDGYASRGITRQAQQPQARTKEQIAWKS